MLFNNPKGEPLQLYVPMDVNYKTPIKKVANWTDIVKLL